MKKSSINKSLNIGIVALVNPAKVNGLSQYIVHLINSLRSLNSIHTFYLITNNEFSEFFSGTIANEKIITIDIPHHPRWLMRPIYFIWQNFIAEFALKKHGIDVIHVPNAIPFVNKTNIPTVTTIHDLAEFEGYRHTYFHRLFRKWATLSSLKFSDRIITVSDFSRTEIIKRSQVSNANTTVSYLASTLKQKKNSDTDNSLKKSKYFLFLLGSGSNKNAVRVIASFIQFNKNNDCALIIIGGNKVRSTFRYAKEIIFKSEVDSQELVYLYKNSIALLYPSLYEGFGLPILEAMSLGVPVITSNRASMPEVAGNAALYVNPESEFEIADAMNRIASDSKLRDQLIEEGYKQASKFSWEKTAIETIKVYESAYIEFDKNN